MAFFIVRIGIWGPWRFLPTENTVGATGFHGLFYFAGEL